MTTHETSLTQRFRYKTSELRYTPEGRESYTVEVFPEYRSGWSKYSQSMFINGNPDVKSAIFEAFQGMAEGTVVLLAIERGRARNGKPDDGEVENYYWNIAGIEENEEFAPRRVAPPATTPAQAVSGDPTRRSIESQTALKAAVEITVANGGGISQVLLAATAFVAWLEGTVTAPAPEPEPAPSPEPSASGTAEESEEEAAY